MSIAYLSLGTNLGEKLENLNKAVAKISALGNITKISSVYQTPSWGFKSDDFLNIALTLETSLDSNQLIDDLLQIESKLGRTRNATKQGYQSRPLDIDIIFFNNLILNSEKLVIPHPRMHQRNFVLIPLVELVPDFMHPVFNKTLKDLSDECKDTSKIIRTDLVIDTYQ